MTHVYITNRDLMVVPLMVEKLQEMSGITGISIVDCGSTYKPLLDYYDTCDVDVCRLTNKGIRASFTCLKHESPYYIVTDGDLDISNFPTNTIERMVETLKQEKDIIKVGCSLQLDDLPDNSYSDSIKQHESKYWSNVYGDYYHADIDTTFAVYRSGRGWGGYGPALRASYAVAKHLLWYLDPKTLPDDWHYYLSNLPKANTGTTWSAKMSQKLEKDND